MTEFSELQEQVIETALEKKCVGCGGEAVAYSFPDGKQAVAWLKGERDDGTQVPCPLCNGTGLSPIATAILAVLRDKHARCGGTGKRKWGNPDMSTGQRPLGDCHCRTGYTLDSVWADQRAKGRIGALAGTGFNLLVNKLPNDKDVELLEERIWWSETGDPDTAFLEAAIALMQSSARTGG